MIRIIVGVLLGFSSSVTCPSNSLLVNYGTRSNLSTTLMVALGALLGDLAVLLLLLHILGGSVQDWVSTQAWFWFLGSIVMFYIAVQQFRARTRGQLPSKRVGRYNGNEDREQPSFREIMRTMPTLKAALSGFSVTAINPFTYVWWVGLFALGITADGGISYGFFAGILAGAAVWFGVISVVLHFVRRILTVRTLRTIHVVSSAILGTYALWLLIEGLKRSL